MTTKITNMDFIETVSRKSLKSKTHFINWSYVGDMALIQLKKFALDGTAFGIKVWHFLDVGNNN